MRNHFQRWVFKPGMLFKSANKWWGDLGLRDFPHEGVDFCWYEDASGNPHRIDRHTKIPVLRAGVVRRIFPDYLGHAVVIEHVATQGATAKSISIYAHTIPVEGLTAGAVLQQGEVVATVADTRQSKVAILPHLHYTLGEVRADIDYTQFVWNDMRNPDLLALRNPLNYLDDPYR